MQLINEKPKIFDDIKIYFPQVRWQNADGSGAVIITYYPNVYCADADLEPQKWVHEKVHLEQQKEYGVEKWWVDYFTDAEFRLEQELEAYQTEVAFIRSRESGFNSEEKHNRIEKIIDDITSPMYGRMISRKQAKKLFR